MEARWNMTGSSVHRAVWAHDVAPEAFDSAAPALSPAVRAVVDAGLAVVRRHQDSRSGIVYPNP